MILLQGHYGFPPLLYFSIGSFNFYITLPTCQQYWQNANLKGGGCYLWFNGCKHVKGSLLSPYPQENPFPFVIRNHHRTQQMKESALATTSQQSIYWLPTKCKTMCWFLGVDNSIKCQPPTCINLRQWATHTHTKMWEKEQPTSQSLPLRRLNCKWEGVIKSFGKDLGSGDQLKGAHSTPWPSFGLKQGRTGKGVSWVHQGKVTEKWSLGVGNPHTILCLERRDNPSVRMM